MTLYYTRVEETDDGDRTVNYEVEVDYTPGRPPPAYRERGDANFCDPGEDEELEVLSVVRVNRDGSETVMCRHHLDDCLDALYDLARDEGEE
jgi:hypothetical protein